MYSAKVLEHFKNPRNVGVIEDANITVQVGEPRCGDALLLFLKVAGERVVNVKYKVFGCGAAIATASMASEMAIGKTFDDVLTISDESIAAALDGLPNEKMHCSNMAAGALHAAINHYRKELVANKEPQQAVDKMPSPAS